MLRMKTIKLIFLLTLVLNMYVVLSESGEDTREDEFIPTHEWQVIKKGQKIPKGLHVRMNLAEGYSEAKLLDPEDSAGSTDKSQALILTEDSIDVTDTKKPVKMDPITLKRIKEKPSRALDNRISDLIQEHINAKAEKPENDDVLLAVLENLEDLVHDIDYGLDFVRHEGLENVIMPNLNSTNKALKAQTLLVLGSCMQNNEEVKLHAFEIGLLQKIHYIFARNNDSTVSLRALFALGSILRTTPIVQSKFVALGGITSCLNALESKDLRLKVKTVNLLNDLMLERKMMEILSEDGDKGQEDFGKYEVDIQKHLLEQNYCILLTNLLEEVTTVDQTDFNAIEIVLFAMENVKTSCIKQYSDRERAILLKIAQNYDAAEVTDDNNDIVMSLRDSLYEITRGFEKQNQELTKEEL